MSSKKNDITLNNYEEYFILYMDNELDAAGMQTVEAFVLLHPHLAEELEMLMCTKLPAEESPFYNKEELLSSSMKLTTVDEQLLLYVDDEVSVWQKTSIAEKIIADKDYALHYSLLLQTKVDVSEIISYPNKKELYRHTEKVNGFPVWMRIAAAVIILLFGSFFFLTNSNKEAIDHQIVTNTPSVNQPTKKNSIPEQKTILVPQQKEEQLLVKAPEVKKKDAVIPKNIPAQNKKVTDVTNDVAIQHDNDMLPIKREVIKLHVARFTTETNINDVAVNKTIAHTPVTSRITASYNNQNDPTITAVTEGDFEVEQKTRGKGFFRKVSRFIQRNTGIGTVNADNELLVGVVALKLK